MDKPEDYTIEAGYDTDLNTWKLFSLAILEALVSLLVMAALGGWRRVVYGRGGDAA